MKNRSLSKLKIDMLTETEMREQLIGNKREYMPENTDENPSSQFMRFIDYIARFSIKWIRKFAELVLNEGFLATASQYNVITEHARRGGYRAKQESPATATLVATLRRDLPLGFIIKKEDVKFQAVDDDGRTIDYELVSDQVVVLPGKKGDTFSFDVIQGITVRDEIIGKSDATPLQSFITMLGFVIPESIIVEVEEYDGDILVWRQYTETDNLLMALPSDMVYELSFTEFGEAIILFGNGVADESGHGKIPGNKRRIRVTYRALLGEQNGNVAEGAIRRMVPPSPVFFVTNPQRATGWSQREDVESLRWNAMRYPRYQKTIGKMDDYIIAAESLPGVGRAYAVPNMFGNNTIAVYVIPSDLSRFTGSRLYEIEKILESRNHVAEVMCVSNAVYEDYDVSFNIRVSDNYVESDVKVACRKALEDYFNPLMRDNDGNRTINNGDNVDPSTINAILRNVPGVAAVRILSPIDVQAFDAWVMPRLGEVTIGTL